MCVKRSKSFLRKLVRAENKSTKVCSFKSNERIRKKVDGPYFEVLAKKSLISDPVMALQRKADENMLQFCEIQIGSRFK